MTKWAVQDAKARFSELLETVLTQGPQMVTKRGVDTAVLIPIDDWKRLQKGAQRSALELLVGNGPRLELELPPRGQWNFRLDRVDLE